MRSRSQAYQQKIQKENNPREIPLDGQAKDPNLNQTIQEAYCKAFANDEREKEFDERYLRRIFDVAAISKINPITQEENKFSLE